MQGKHGKDLFCLFCYSSLNNGQNLKIQSSTESAGPALSSQFDNPQVSLIRTKCWAQKGADYWKFTVFEINQLIYSRTPLKRTPLGLRKRV